MRLTVLLAAVVTVVIALLAFAPVQAQQGEISIYKVGCLSGHDSILTGGHPRFVLKFVNNTGEKVDIANGFRVWSPDGAVWDSVTIDSVGYDFGGPSTLAGYFDITLALLSFPPAPANGPDTLGVFGSGRQVNPEKQLPNAFNDTVLAITLYCPPEGTVNDGKHICIDTSFFQPGGTWTWVGASLGQYYPKFLAPNGPRYVAGEGYCYLLWNPPCLNASSSNQQVADPESIECVSCLKCCRGYTGNVNMLGIIDLSDLSGLINYLTGGGYSLPCEAEANLNASGVVDLADLSALISYLTGGGFLLPVCGS